MLYCADYYSPHLLGDSFLRLKLILWAYNGQFESPRASRLKPFGDSLLRAERTNTLPPHLSTQSTNGVFKTRAGLGDSWCVCGVEHKRPRGPQCWAYI